MEMTFYREIQITNHISHSGGGGLFFLLIDTCANPKELALNVILELELTKKLPKLDAL